jgi:hypothetical protein
MSNRIELLLKSMAGRTAQEPITCSYLAILSGLPEDEVQQLLDVMYETIPATVNRVKITRLGVEQTFYWPTGVVNRFMDGPSGAQRFNEKHAAYRRTEANKPPVPVEQKTDQAEPIKEKTIMKPRDKIAIGPKAMIVVEHLQQVGKLGTQSISEILDTHSSNVRSVMEKVVTLGMVRIEKQPQPGRKSTNVYVLAEGVTPEDFIVSRNGLGSIITEKKMDSDKALNEIIREESERQVSNNLQQDLPKSPEPTLRKLHVAYTSDNIVILSGLTDIPIELSADDSRTLINFIGNIKRSE